jgi:hypothetical protein
MDANQSDVVPLVFTSKGNLPVKSLEQSVEWKFSNTSIEFSEIYKLDGEVVKQSGHIYKLPEGTEFNLAGGNLGGGPVNG